MANATHVVNYKVVTTLAPVEGEQEFISSMQAVSKTMSQVQDNARAMSAVLKSDIDAGAGYMQSLATQTKNFSSEITALQYELASTADEYEKRKAEIIKLETKAAETKDAKDEAAVKEKVAETREWITQQQRLIMSRGASVMTQAEMYGLDRGKGGAVSRDVITGVDFGTTIFGKNTKKSGTDSSPFDVSDMFDIKAARMRLQSMGDSYTKMITRWYGDLSAKVSAAIAGGKRSGAMSDLFKDFMAPTTGEANQSIFGMDRALNQMVDRLVGKGANNEGAILPQMMLKDLAIRDKQGELTDTSRENLKEVVRNIILAQRGVKSTSAFSVARFGKGIQAADSFTTVADYVKTFAPALEGLFDKDTKVATYQDENGEERQVEGTRSAAIMDLIAKNGHGLNGKGLTQLFKAASKNSSLMQAMTRAGMVQKTAAGDFMLTKTKGKETELAAALIQDLLVKINGGEQGAKIVGGGTVYRPGYGLNVAEEDLEGSSVENLMFSFTRDKKNEYIGGLAGRTGELVRLIAGASDDSRSDATSRIIARRALSRMQAGGAATENLRALDILYRIYQDKDALAKSDDEGLKTDISRISYAPGVRDRQDGFYIKQIFPFEEAVDEKEVDVARANREKFISQWQSEEKGAHIPETVSYTNPVTGKRELLTRAEYLKRREKDESSAAAYIKPYFDNTRRYTDLTQGTARGLTYHMTDPSKIARTGMVVMDESPITRALGLGHAESGEFTDKIAEIAYGDLTKLSKEQEDQYINMLKSFGVIEEDEKTGELTFNPDPKAQNGYIFHVNHGQSGVTSRLIKAEDYQTVNSNFRKFTDYAAKMLGVDSSVFGDFWHNALPGKKKFKDFSAFAKFMDNLNKSHTPGTDITGGAIDWVNMLDANGDEVTPEGIFQGLFGGLGRESFDPNIFRLDHPESMTYSTGAPDGSTETVQGAKKFKLFTPKEISSLFGSTIGITGQKPAALGAGGSTPRTAFVDFEALWAQTGARGKKWGFDDTAEGSSFIDSAFMRTGTSQVRGGLAFKGNMTAQKDMIKMFAENFGTVEEDANGGKKYTVEMPTPYGEKVTLEAVYDKDGKMIGSNYDAMIGKSMVKNKELYVGGASLKDISKSIAEGTYDPTTAGIYYDYMKQQYDRRTDPSLNGLFGTSSGAENITFEEFVNGNEELRQEAMRRANLGMTAILAASGGLSVAARFKDDARAKNIGIQAAQWIPVSPEFMEAQAESYEQMRARTYTIEGIRAMYGDGRNEENEEMLAGLAGRMRKGNTDEYFTPEEWMASHESDIERKRQDYLRARQQDMASGMIVDFNDGDIAVRGAPEGSHRFNLIESEIKNDDPNKKYMTTDFKNERVVTNAYLARLEQLGITEDKKDVANWVQTLNEFDMAMGDLDSAGWVDTEDELTRGKGKVGKAHYDKEFEKQAKIVYANLMSRAQTDHSDVLQYTVDKDTGKHVGFGFDSFLTALKALQTAKHTLQGELNKQTNGDFGNLTNEQLMGIMTLQGFGKEGDKYKLGKGLIDFENMDALKEAIIRSPTGFNQIIARTNYASFMKPVLEKMGVSTSGLFLSLGDMQKLSGADWDGDMIKTVLSRRYSLDKGDKAASGFTQVADIGGKLRKTELSQKNRKSSFDLVESIEAQEAAIEALKLFDDYDQFEQQLDDKLHVKTLNNVDKGRAANEKVQILNRAALIREIQGRLGARMGMGLTSAVGSRLSSFDLVDPRYSQLARIAQEANHIYDIETTNAKRPTTYQMTDEQYQALGFGPEWGKMFGLLEGAEDVVMSKKGEYIDSKGVVLDPKLVHRVGGRKDANEHENAVFVKYTSGGIGRKLQNGGFAIDEMQFMSKYNRQHLLATMQSETAKLRGFGDTMMSDELVKAFTDEAEYETDAKGRIKTTSGGDDLYGATRTGGGLGYGLFDYAEWSNGIQGLDKVKRLMKNARYIKAQQAGANHMVISDIERDILALQMAEANAQIEKYVDDYFVKNKIEGEYVHLKNPYYEEGSTDADKSSEYMDLSRKDLINRLKKEAGIGSISMMLGGRKFMNGGEWDTISNGITEDSLNMMLLSEDESKRRIAAAILKNYKPGDQADLADTSYDASFAGRYGYVDRMFGRAGSGYTVKRLKMAYEKNGLTFDEQAYIQRQNRGMRDAIDKARKEAAANGETISAQEAYKRASRAARTIGDSRYDPSRLPEQMKEIDYYRQIADRIREGAGAFVYDTETTGTDVHGSSIVQISAAKFKDATQRYNTLVNPGKNHQGVDIVTTDEVKPALEINGITPEQILNPDTPTTAKALEGFIEFGKGDVYSIGYNSEGFDDRIVKNQAAKAGITGKQVIPAKNIDALMMLRTLVANGGIVDGKSLDETLSERIGDAYAREVYYENFGGGSEEEAANAASAATSAANQIELALRGGGRRSLMTGLGDFKPNIKGATKLTTIASSLLGLPIESLTSTEGAHDSSFDTLLTGAVTAKLMQSAYETFAKQAQERFKDLGETAPAGYMESLKAGAVYYAQQANAFKHEITGEDFYTTTNAAIDEKVVNDALALRVQNGSGAAGDASRIKTYFANTWTDETKVSLIQSLVGDVTKDVENVVKAMEGSAFGQNTPMAGRTQELKKQFDEAIAKGDYVAITSIAREIQQVTESSEHGRKYFNNDKLNQLKKILVEEQQATGAELDHNGGYGYIDPNFSWDKMIKDRAAARAKLAEMATRQEEQVEAGEAIAQAKLDSTTVGFQTQDANDKEQYVVLDENGQARAIAKGQAVYEKFSSMKEQSEKLRMGFNARNKDYSIDETTAAKNKNKARMGYEFGNIIADYEYAQRMQRAHKATDETSGDYDANLKAVAGTMEGQDFMKRILGNNETFSRNEFMDYLTSLNNAATHASQAVGSQALSKVKGRGQVATAYDTFKEIIGIKDTKLNELNQIDAMVDLIESEKTEDMSGLTPEEKKAAQNAIRQAKDYVTKAGFTIDGSDNWAETIKKNTAQARTAIAGNTDYKFAEDMAMFQLQSAMDASMLSFQNLTGTMYNPLEGETAQDVHNRIMNTQRDIRVDQRAIEIMKSQADNAQVISAMKADSRYGKTDKNGDINEEYNKEYTESVDKMEKRFNASKLKNDQIASIAQQQVDKEIEKENFMQDKQVEQREIQLNRLNLRTDRSIGQHYLGFLGNNMFTRAASGQLNYTNQLQMMQEQYDQRILGLEEAKLKTQDPLQQQKLQAEIDKANEGKNKLQGEIDANSGFGGFMKNLGGNVLSQVITKVTQAFKKLINAAIQFNTQWNTAMAGVSAKSGLTGTALQELGDKIEAQATKLKVSSVTLANTYKALFAAGYDTSNIEHAAEVMTKFSAVTGQDVTKSMRQLTQVVKSGLVGSLDEAMDMLTAISDQSVATVADISKVLSKMSSVSISSGMTSGETTGLATYAAEIMGGSASVGNDLGLIVSRLSQLSTSSDISSSATYKDSEGREYSLSDLSDLQSVTGVQFMSDANSETLTPIEIMKNIAAQWNDMSDAYRNTFTSLFGGTSGRQANTFTSLMNALSLDPDLLDQYIDTAENSSGTVESQYNTITSTVASAKQQATSAFNDLITDFFGGSNGWLSSAQISFYDALTNLFTGNNKVVVDFDEYFEIKSDTLNTTIDELEDIRENYTNLTDTLTATDTEAITSATSTIAASFPALAEEAEKAAESVASLDGFLEKLIEYRDQLGSEHLDTTRSTYDYSSIQETYDKNNDMINNRFSANMSSSYNPYGYKSWTDYAKGFYKKYNSFSILGNSWDDIYTFAMEDTQGNSVDNWIGKFLKESADANENGYTNLYLLDLMTYLAQGGAYADWEGFGKDENSKTIIESILGDTYQRMLNASVSTDYTAEQREAIENQMGAFFGLGNKDSVFTTMADENALQLLQETFDVAIKGITTTSGESISGDLYDQLFNYVKMQSEYFDSTTGHYRTDLATGPKMATDMYTKYLAGFMNGTTFDEESFNKSGNIGNFMYKGQALPGNTWEDAYEYLQTHWDYYESKIAEYDAATAAGIEYTGTSINPEIAEQKYLASLGEGYEDQIKRMAFSNFKAKNWETYESKGFGMEALINAFENIFASGNYDEYLTAETITDSETGEEILEEFTSEEGKKRVKGKASDAFDKAVEKKKAKLVEDKNETELDRLNSILSKYGGGEAIYGNWWEQGKIGQDSSGRLYIVDPDDPDNIIYLTDATSTYSGTGKGVTYSTDENGNIVSSTSLPSKNWFGSQVTDLYGNKVVSPLKTIIGATSLSESNYDDVYKTILQTMSYRTYETMMNSGFTAEGTKWADERITAALNANSNLLETWRDSINGKYSSDVVYEDLIKQYLGSSVSDILTNARSTQNNFIDKYRSATRLISYQGTEEDLKALQEYYGTDIWNDMSEQEQANARYSYYDQVMSSYNTTLAKEAGLFADLLNSVDYDYLYSSTYNGDEITSLSQLRNAAQLRLDNATEYADILQAQDIIDTIDYLQSTSGTENHLFDVSRNDEGTWYVTTNPEGVAKYGMTDYGSLTSGGDITYNSKLQSAPLLQQVLNAGYDYDKMNIETSRLEGLHTNFDNAGLVEYLNAMKEVETIQAAIAKGGTALSAYGGTEEEALKALGIAQNNVTTYKVKLQFEVDNIEGVRHYFDNITTMVEDVLTNNENATKSLSTMTVEGEKLSQLYRLAEILQGNGYDISALTPAQQQMALNYAYGDTNLSMDTILSEYTTTYLERVFGESGLIYDDIEAFARDARLMGTANGVNDVKAVNTTYAYSWDDYIRYLAYADYDQQHGHTTDLTAYNPTSTTSSWDPSVESYQEYQSRIASYDTTGDVEYQQKRAEWYATEADYSYYMGQIDSAQMKEFYLQKYLKDNVQGYDTRASIYNDVYDTNNEGIQYVAYESNDYGQSVLQKKVDEATAEFEQLWQDAISGNGGLFDIVESTTEIPYSDMEWAQAYGFNPYASYHYTNGDFFYSKTMQSVQSNIDAALGSEDENGIVQADQTAVENVRSALTTFQTKMQSWNELDKYLSFDLSKNPEEDAYDITEVLAKRPEIQQLFTSLTGIEMDQIENESTKSDAQNWFDQQRAMLLSERQEIIDASEITGYSDFIDDAFITSLSAANDSLDLTEHYLDNIDSLCTDISVGGTKASDAIKSIGDSAYQLSQNQALMNEIKYIVYAGGDITDLTADQANTIMQNTNWGYDELMGTSGNSKLLGLIASYQLQENDFQNDAAEAYVAKLNKELADTMGTSKRIETATRIGNIINGSGLTFESDEAGVVRIATEGVDYSKLSADFLKAAMEAMGYDYDATWVNPSVKYGYSYNTMQTYASATGATADLQKTQALTSLVQTSQAMNQANGFLNGQTLEESWGGMNKYQRDIIASVLGVSATDIDNNLKGYSTQYSKAYEANLAERREMLSGKVAMFDTERKYGINVSDGETSESDEWDYSQMTDEQYLQFAKDVVSGNIAADESVKELAQSYLDCAEAADSAATAMAEAKLAAAQTAAETQKMADVKTQILDLQNLGLAGEEAAEKVEAIIDAANFETQPEGLTNILTVIEQIKTGAIEAGQAMENILYSAGYSANISNDRVDNLAESAKAFFNIDEDGTITGFKGESTEEQNEMYYKFVDWWKQLQENNPAMAAAMSSRYSWFDILANQGYNSDWFDSYNNGAGVGFTIAQNYTDIQNQKDLTDWANFVAEHNVGNNNWYEGIDSDIQTLITSENEVDKSAKATSIAQSIFDLSEKIRYAQMGYQAGNTRQQDVLGWSAADWADTKSVKKQIEDWIAEYGNYNEMLDFIKEEYPDVYEMITSAKSTIHDQTYDTSTNAMYSAKSAAQTEYVLDNMMSEITKNFTTNGQLNEGVTAEQIAASAQDYLLTHGASDILYYNEDFLSWYNGLLYNNDSVATNYEAGMSQFDLGRKNGYTSKQSKYFTPALLAEGFAAMQSGEWSDWFEENIDQNDVEDFKTAIEDRYGTYATNVINGTAMTDEDRADLIRKANQQAKAADWTQMVEAGTMSQEAYDTATAIEEIRAGYSNYTDSEYLEKIAEQRKSITEQQDQYNMYTAALDEYNASDKTQQDVETFLTAIGGDLSQSGNADYVAQQIKDAKTAKQSSYDYIEDLKTAFADNPELLALLGLDTGYSEYQSNWEAGTYTSAFNDDAMSQKFGEMLSSATSEEDFVSAVDSDANMQTWLLQHEDMLQLYKDLRDQQTSLTKAQKDYAKQTGKDSKSISEYSKSMLKLRESIQNVKYYVDKGTYNHSEGSDDMKDIASILGLSEQTVMAMTDGEIKQKLTTELEGLGEDYSDELQKVYDTVKGMNMSEYASGLNGEGKMTYQLGDIELVAGEIKEVGLEEAMAIAQSLGQEAIYNELASVEGMGGTVAMQQWIDDAGYYHVIMNGVELTNATGKRSSSSSGGGKSAAEKKVEKWKHKIEDRKHQINIAKGYEEYYQETGNLAQYGKELTVENQAQQNYIDTQEAAIKDYRKSLASVKAGSDDYYTLTDAIQEAEEEILSAKTAIEKNTKALEENRKAMRKTRTDLEDYYKQLIESQEDYEESVLAGTVDMEDLILDAIKDRYQKEWDLQKEDLEKKKEALQEEKDMIDERLQARKDAEDAADEYEEIAELEKQLALISMDSTRASEAAEIREQLAEKKNALAWEEAETEAEAQSSILDDQINGIDEYIEAEDERVSNYLEDANNFADQVAEILGGTDEEIMQWLKDNVDEYGDYLDAAQEQQVEKWLDTYKQMMGITDTYWDEINSLISGGFETGAAYLMTTQDYINASDTERYDMLMELKDMVDSYSSAYNTTKISNDYDALMAAALTKVEDAISSGNDQDINSALSYYEKLVTGTAEGLHTDDFSEAGTAIAAELPKVTPAVTAATDVIADTNKQLLADAESRKTDGTNTRKSIDALVSGLNENTASVKNFVTAIAADGTTGTSKVLGLTKKKTSAADGGVFNYTGQVLVHGTNEHPEYIFNEDQLKALSKIGYTPYNVSIGSDAYGSSNTIGDVSITINQAEIASDVDVDRLAAQVGEKFVQQISTQGYRTGRF